MVVFHAVGLIAAAALFGAMLFFSAVMAPLIFIKLEAETAGTFIRAVFPWYYLVVGGLALVAAAAFSVLRPWDALILAAIAAGAYVSRQQIMQRINRYRDRALGGEPSADTAFARLHRLSVWINGAQLVGSLAVLLRLAVS